MDRSSIRIRAVLCLIAIVAVVGGLWTGASSAVEDARGLDSATTAKMLSGRVYEGDVGVEPPGSTPLSGVRVELHASNNPGAPEQYLTGTSTNAEGWYELPVLGSWEFYFIIEQDLSDYYSVGATSVSGVVWGPNLIRYTWEALGGTLSGNKFWDKRSLPATPTATPTVTPGPPPDLQLTKRVVDPPGGIVTQGDIVTFEIVIENGSSSALASLPLSDDYNSDHLEYVDASPQPNFVAVVPGSGTAVWQDLAGPSPHGFGSPLLPGHSFIVTIRFRAVQIGNTENCASLTPVVNGFPVFMVSCVPVQVIEPGAPATNVEITKILIDPPGGVANVGDIVTFQIAVTNAGETLLAPVVLGDTYTGSIEYVDFSPPPDLALEVPGSGSASWSNLAGPPPSGFGSPLSPGHSFIVTVRCRAKGVGDHENCAEVQAQAGDVTVTGKSCDNVLVQEPGGPTPTGTRVGALYRAYLPIVMKELGLQGLSSRTVSLTAR
jgi:uncharacterized repeat protein (TIGR01451 family)